jgi:hypothetical protein
MLSLQVKPETKPLCGIKNKPDTDVCHPSCGNCKGKNGRDNSVYQERISNTNKKHYNSRLPSLRVPHLNTVYATDKFSAKVMSKDEYTTAQLYCEREKLFECCLRWEKSRCLEPCLTLSGSGDHWMDYKIIMSMYKQDML